MKSKFYIAALLVIITGYYQQVFSQANTSLSNLISPTAINQSLTPGVTNTQDLGSTAKNWKNIYVGTGYYLKNFRIIYTPGTSNFFAGQSAGNANTTGFGNSAFGDKALYSNTSGTLNVAIGPSALYTNTTGFASVAVGDSALQVSTSSLNVAVGSKALGKTTIGSGNSALGYRALRTNITGSKNTSVGYFADVLSSGLSNATAIGAYAQVHTSNSLVLGSVNGINGATATVNVGIGTNAPTERLHVVGNQLLDGNLTFATGAESIQFANPGATPAPMMYMFTSGTVNTNRMVIAHSPSFPTWGLQYADSGDQFDFLGAGSSRMTVNLSTGNIGIGVTAPVYKLEVCGTIRAKEVRVETGWCDYVFEKDYKLRSIEELEKFVNDNKHLPGIAPASEVEREGLKVAEMNKAMMEKIEELSLYIIQLNKENKRLQAEIEALKQK
ncbi:MAG: hypothetical protein QM768_18780 [Agriterribacter sp.]